MGSMVGIGIYFLGYFFVGYGEAYNSGIRVEEVAGIYVVGVIRVFRFLFFVKFRVLFF